MLGRLNGAFLIACFKLFYIVVEPVCFQLSQQGTVGVVPIASTEKILPLKLLIVLK